MNCLFNNNMQMTIGKQMREKATPTSQSLRSIRSRSNTTSLRRSCLLSRSGAINASQVQIVTSHDSGDHHSAANTNNTSNSSLPLGQRRCQSLGKFPGDEPRQHASTISNRQYLCVPQHIFPGQASKTPRYRKESRSLDLFPTEMRISDRSFYTSGEEEEQALLQNDITLTIPNGDQYKPNNGCLKSPDYQNRSMLHNDVEDIDAESFPIVKRLSLASAELPDDTDEQMNFCEQLYQLEHLEGDHNKRDTKDAPISSFNKKLKQLFVNFKPFSSASAKSPPLSMDDHLHEERESVV